MQKKKHSEECPFRLRQNNNNDLPGDIHDYQASHPYYYKSKLKVNPKRKINHFHFQKIYYQLLKFIHTIINNLKINFNLSTPFIFLSASQNLDPHAASTHSLY